MDPYTQRLLLKAEQRSRQLGIGFAPPEETLLSQGVIPMDFSPVSGILSPKKLTKTPEGSPQRIANSGNKLIDVMNKSKDKFSSTKTSSNNSKISSNVNKHQVIESVQKELPSTKVLRHFSTFDKENNDLGIEINIMTPTNIAVQVEVEEHEIEELRAKTLAMESDNSSVSSPQPMAAKIRDVSRSRLQRLGALYSDTNSLSSPIHRTEASFHASGDDLEVTSCEDRESRRNHKGLEKLAALARNMNEWEDDITPRDINVAYTPLGPPPPKPALPSRDRLSKCLSETEESTKFVVPKPAERTSIKGNEQLQKNQQEQKSQSSKTYLKESETQQKSKAVVNKKDLFSKKEPIRTNVSKWDQDVIQSLEAQGFQRRDSSNVGLNSLKQTQKNMMTGGNMKSGLVLDRAAIFEQQQSSQNAKAAISQKPAKDPVELSLKERMQLFEKNKTDAPLLPKGPFGMSLPTSRVQPQLNQTNKKEQTAVNSKAGNNSASGGSNVNSSGVMPLVSSKAESKLRDKVAALFSATNENRTIDDIRKQREEEMQLLGQRFNKNKDILPSLSEKDGAGVQKEKLKTPPPPPPPPQPTNRYGGNLYAQLNKRRSCDYIDEESKRARKLNGISRNIKEDNDDNIDADVDDDSFSDNQECTTATASAFNTGDEMSKEPLRGQRYHRPTGIAGNPIDADTEEQDEDRCFQRRILKNVTENQSASSPSRNSKNKAVHYAEQNYYISNNYTDDEENYNNVNKRYNYNQQMDSSTNSSEVINEYLDEVLDNADTSNDGSFEGRAKELELDEDYLNQSNLSDESHCTAASHSFSFRKSIPSNKGNRNIDHNSKTENALSPVKSELTVNKGDDNNLVTLVHTVSFYRRQQNANSASCSSTPVRRVCRDEEISCSPHGKKQKSITDRTMSPNRNSSYNSIDDEDLENTANESETDGEEVIAYDAKRVKEKIEKLLVEVGKQQQIITQTSQALNLCAATVEFSGSTESVEGERHLLVATHRRLACLDEIQRLQIEKTLRPTGTPNEKGCLTIKDITVPLRQDYVRKLANETISGHHLVCVLKYNEHVLATQTVPTLPGLLAVKFPDVLKLNNVYADFKITLEVYGMTAQREVLPHEIKYHINVGKKGAIRTPKKKTNDNRLIMPPVQSPAGPHVVRTPALVQYGFALFSLREIQRTTWTLTQVLGVSPLEGLVHMKVNCELSVSVEYRGFLTMFEDISGFGAWHRRWCHLNGTMLSYWKYPEDEKKKLPMGSIDLYTCITQKVTLVPRDICARLNTILLEFERPAQNGDTESLIIIPKGRTTVLRYLLSADTKEEREEWCAYLNKSLTLLRAWGPPPQ